MRPKKILFNLLVFSMVGFSILILTLSLTFTGVNSKKCYCINKDLPINFVLLTCASFENCEVECDRINRTIATTFQINEYLTHNDLFKNYLR